MEIRKIEIEMGRTVPVGHYETFRCRVVMQADLEPGEYSEEKYEELSREVYRRLQIQIARIMPD